MHRDQELDNLHSFVVEECGRLEVVAEVHMKAVAEIVEEVHRHYIVADLVVAVDLLTQQKHNHHLASTQKHCMQN